ncbi:MAG: hypothetical protein ABFC96_08900 [Thermoguttaceae bacterium]
MQSLLGEMMIRQTMVRLSVTQILCCLTWPAVAGQLTVDLVRGGKVTAVAAVARWDKDGNPHHAPDPKAKIGDPAVDARAARVADGRWVFKDLTPGKYDLVILGKDRLRVEGFQYAPVRDDDRFLPRDASVDEETRDAVLAQIRQSPHYENRVEPLYLGGDDKTCRVLMMLVRDKPTSFEADSRGAATIRHEVWQFTWNYGGWQKERRTKVLDRVLLPRDELRRWTWLWDPAIGGIEVGARPSTIRYEMPQPSEKRLKGLYPIRGESGATP